MVYIMTGNNATGEPNRVVWRDDHLPEWTLNLYSGQYSGGWSWGYVYVKKHSVMVF